jgi:DNA-binding response OmpR family regulator
MTAGKPVILVVEDEPAMRKGLAHNLQYEGFEVRAASDGDAGLAAARAGGVDLVILDVMLPRADGFEVLRRLRGDGFMAPVLLLTAKGLEADKLKGFKLGADDYITKPFSVQELIARVRAVLRRAASGRPAASPDRFAFRDIEVDFTAMEVRKEGRLLEFSLKELEMLRLLIQRKGQPVTREEMLNVIWGYEPGAMPTTRTVDTHIARIRSKLGDSGGCDFIKTIHKVGYKFQDGG